MAGPYLGICPAGLGTLERSHQTSGTGRTHPQTFSLSFHHTKHNHRVTPVLKHRYFRSTARLVSRAAQYMLHNHLTNYYYAYVAASLSGNALVLINAVALRQAQLVLGWVTVRGYTILVFNQSHSGLLSL